MGLKCSEERAGTRVNSMKQSHEVYKSIIILRSLKVKIDDANQGDTSGVSATGGER